MAFLLEIPLDLLIKLGLTVTGLAGIGTIVQFDYSTTVLVDKAVKDFVDEIKEDNNRGRCCCGCDNSIGPSGKYKVHFIMKSNRKEALEAALHYENADGVEYHPSNAKDKYPHFHPTRKGKKIPGVHFQFPN